MLFTHFLTRPLRITSSVLRWCLQIAEFYENIVYALNGQVLMSRLTISYENLRLLEALLPILRSTTPA